METKRTHVIADREIYSHVCPNCFVRPKALCVDPRGKPLAIAHPERIKDAQARAMRRAFGDVLDATDKSLILYYAYIMLCDSVSTRAQQLFGRQFSSEDIQAHFASEAIKELQKDGLLPHELANTRKSS